MSIIHAEPKPVQISNIFFIISYDASKLNLWFITVTAFDLIKIVSISYLLLPLLHLFKVISATKVYLKPLFSLNKSLNKSLILYFAKNKDSFKLLLSVTSTL